MALGRVCPGKDRIDDAQRRVRADALVATPSPLRPAECSSARTTVVPTATMRPPLIRGRRMAEAVVAGMRYGSSNGRRASSAASPVDEMPAVRDHVTGSATGFRTADCDAPTALSRRYPRCSYAQAICRERSPGRAWQSFCRFERAPLCGVVLNWSVRALIEQVCRRRHHPLRPACLAA